MYWQAPRNISRSARETNVNIGINIVIHMGVKGGAMPYFSVRAALVAAVLLSTTTGGLLESAYAQSAKAKSKPQATGQVVCDGQGCRPVAPGCHLEQQQIGKSGPWTNKEVCK
jgi:hypothetical protein